MSSLWADYLQERTGKETLETDKGFAIFKTYPDASCYLEDIYVVPEHRRSGHGTELAERVCLLAVARGCKTLIGSVDVTAYGATESLKAVLSFGMEVFAVQGNLILLQKKLGGA